MRLCAKTKTGVGVLSVELAGVTVLFCVLLSSDNVWSCSVIPKFRRT